MTDAEIHYCEQCGAMVAIVPPVEREAVVLCEDCENDNDESLLAENRQTDSILDNPNHRLGDWRDDA